MKRFNRAFVSVILLASSVGHAQSPTPTPTSAETALAKPSDLDQRLNALQSNKDCIRNAKSKADIAKCRGSIEIKREQIKVH